MMDNAQVPVDVSTKVELSIGSRIGTGVILGLGTAFIASYLMAGFFFFSGGQQPLPRDIGQTTCGTYTNPDGGLNLPIVPSGQIDRDCSTLQTGDDVCVNGTRPHCILARPTPPNAVVTYTDDGRADVLVKWTTDTPTQPNCVIYLPTFVAQDAWRCIWGSGEPGCPAPAVLCEGQLETSHSISINDLPRGMKWYFGVGSFAQSFDLRSEVRWFSTSPTGGASPSILKTLESESAKQEVPEQPLTEVITSPGQVIWNTQAGTPLGSFPQLAGLHTTQQGILGSAAVGPTYLNPPTDYSLTNSTLFVTGANGRVGINTVTPNSAYKLDVNGKMGAPELCLNGVCRTAWSGNEGGGNGGGASPIMNKLPADQGGI